MKQSVTTRTIDGGGSTDKVEVRAKFTVRCGRHERHCYSYGIEVTLPPEPSRHGDPWDVHQAAAAVREGARRLLWELGTGQDPAELDEFLDAVVRAQVDMRERAKVEEKGGLL